MSSRHYDYDKGSSRSTRDDSRHRAGEARARRRSRSRSPRRHRSPLGGDGGGSRHSRYSPETSRSRDWDYDDKQSRSRRKHSSESDEEVPAPPPPPRISKISIGFSKPKGPIKMTLAGPAKTVSTAPKPTVASVFNDDDDDEEPEEMPAEAKMRMKNIGRETPTSAGPNSFGKTKQGFCDAKKLFERNLKEALETPDSKPPTLPKFPQTIYKLKGP